MVRVAIGLIMMALMHGNCYAQSAELLRLRAIEQGKHAKKDFFKDTSYIDALNEIAGSYYTISADSVFLYANRARDYAKNIGYSRGESNALRQLGNGYRLTGDYTNMLYSYHEAYSIAEKIADYRMMGKTLISMAQSYTDMKKNDEAMPLAERARFFFIQTADSINLNKSLNTIGEIWYRRKQYDSALLYFKQTTQVARAIKNESQYIISSNQEGKVLYAKGQYAQALPYYLHSLDYFTHTGDRMLVTMSATMVARSYLGLKKYPEALTYAQQSLRAASTLGSLIEIKNAYCILTDIYKARGDYRNALQYMEHSKRLSDTLVNDQMRNRIARLEAKYEYEKKEIALREQQARKDALNRDILRGKEQKISFAIIVILFLGTLTFLLFRSRAAKQKTNHILKAKNGEISRQKEEIEDQSLQLLLNNQQRDKLFGIIAHDLKTPLHSLRLTLDLLKAKALSEYEITGVMEELRQDADYSARLVGNLLSWANSQLKGTEVVPVMLNIRQLTDYVLVQFQKQATDKKIILNAELPTDMAVYADKDMVLLVMRNLISNAIKFCRAGDIITITGKMAGNAIEFCVADTGIGIKQDILEKIKEQKIITTSGTANEKGTGLGMLLCREFVELNHGMLRVESEWGQGCRCYFTLPAAL